MRLIEHDTGAHFDFEERELFPRMVDAGEGDIAALLGEEHDAIREAAAELLPPGARRPRGCSPMATSTPSNAA